MDGRGNVRDHRYNPNHIHPEINHYLGRCCYLRAEKCRFPMMDHKVFLHAPTLPRMWPRKRKQKVSSKTCALRTK